jgi:hypothetical protein
MRPRGSLLAGSKGIEVRSVEGAGGENDQEKIYEKLYTHDSPHLVQ